MDHHFLSKKDYLIAIYTAQPLVLKFFSFPWESIAQNSSKLMLCKKKRALNFTFIIILFFWKGNSKFCLLIIPCVLKTVMKKNVLMSRSLSFLISSFIVMNVLPPFKRCFCFFDLWCYTKQVLYAVFCKEKRSPVLHFDFSCYTHKLLKKARN